MIFWEPFVFFPKYFVKNLSRSTIYWGRDEGLARKERRVKVVRED